MESRETKILYLIQLPPPVHGVSTINSIIYKSPLINSGLKKSLLELKFSDKLSDLRKFNFAKIRRFFTLAGRLRKVLRQDEPDFVYFSVILVGKGLWRDLLLVMIIKRSGSTPIYHVHNRGIGRNARRPLFRSLYRYVFNNSTVIHLSDELVEREIKPLAGKNTRMFSVPNGIPGVLPYPRSLNRGPITLLFISNLFEEKGIFDLLKIMSNIIKERADIRLIISGEFLRKNVRIRLNNAINEGGLIGAVTLLDPVYDKDKERVYSGADIFVFPSYFRMECFPLVLLEAMSHGMPIVSSDIGAIPEMIENGKEGILVRERDFEGFSRAVLQLSEKPELRKKVGLAARNKFKEKYTSAHLENSIRTVFEQSIKEVSSR